MPRFPVSCFQVSNEAEQHVGKTRFSGVDQKEDRTVSSVQDAVRSRSPASHIVHHQPRDSNKAQVLARVPTWRQRATWRFLHSCRKRSPSRGELEVDSFFVFLDG